MPENLSQKINQIESKKNPKPKIAEVPQPKKAANSAPEPKKVDMKSFLDGAITSRALKSITPEMAEYFLENRLPTRKIRPQTVRQYAEAMKNEEWKSEASEPLAFTRSGKNCNGQHRLSAVVESGLATRFYVQIIDEQDLHVIDVGVRRTGADILFQMYPDLGTRKAKALAAAALWTHAYQKVDRTKKEGRFNIPRLVNSDYEQILEQHPRMLKSLEIIMDFVPRKGVVLSAGPAIALHYLITRSKLASADVIAGFFRSLYDGGNVKRGSALLAARDRLKDDPTMAERLSQKAKFALIINAWKNRDKADVKLADLLWKEDSSFPVLK